MKKVELVVPLMMLLLISVKTPASIITFTHEGRGSGILNGIPFPESDFVVTTTGNTDHRESHFSGIFSIDHLSASISITGLGNFDFLAPTLTFVNNAVQIAGLTSGKGAEVYDLFWSPTDPLLQTWDMLSSIGPISGVGRILQFRNVPTTGGELTFYDGRPEATFTATIIPEPVALSLLALGGLLIRKRKHQP